MIYVEKSYAKVNLFLQVLGKRSDGYHDLNTLFSRIDLFDTITVEPAGEFRLTCNHPDVPVDEQNLITKVRNILKNEYYCPCDVHVHIEKSIPMGGGLGGGSSNAATFLQMIDNIFELSFNHDEKVKILASIGSDTVYFLHEAPMLGSSRGEVLEPVPPVEQMGLLIVNPGIFVSTGEIFNDENLRLTAPREVIRMRQPLTLKGLTEVMVNDMEAAVFKRYPKIKQIKETLEAKGAAKAMMSGSGSTVFGIYENQSELDEVYEYFKECFPEYFVMKTINI